MFVFETKGITTMELLILDHLNWKMKSSTPCSFVDYFLSKITSEQQFPSGSSMLNSIDLILKMPKCIYLSYDIMFNLIFVLSLN